MRREELDEGPRDWPWPKVPEHSPTVLSAETQDAVLEAIAEPDRGLFLALARMGLRPGEAVALDAADYTDGWITVARARKGKRLGDPIRATKTGRPKRLPVPDELAAWIAAHVPQTARLERRPLFVNPRTGERWTPTSMGRVWKRACKEIGVEAGLYEGTKHSFATTRSAAACPSGISSGSSATLRSNRRDAMRASPTRRSSRCCGSRPIPRATSLGRQGQGTARSRSIPTATACRGGSWASVCGWQ